MDKVCRACLLTKETFNYILYENVPAQDYTFCTSIEVHENEDLPKALCDNCYELLIKFAAFKKKCTESQDTLVGYKNNSKFENEVCEADESQDSYEEKPFVDFETREIKIEDPSDRVKEIHDIKARSDEYFLSNDLLNTKRRKCKVSKIKSKRKKSDPKEKVRKKINHYSYECEVCHKKFGYRARFEAHKLTHEGKEMSIECKECKKTFSTWQSHKRHVVNEHSVVNLSNLKCPKCGKLCKSVDSMKMHEKRHGTNSVHVCDMCGKQFNAAQILKIHLQVHEEDRKKECACELCGKKFYSKYLLSAHNRRVHDNRVFICNICDCHFNEKHNLIKHIATHEGKKYSCNICLKAYSNPSTIVVHRRTHTGERPYQCDRCPKAFMCKRALTDHVRVHTGERPFKCRLCDQSFNQKGTLWRHNRTHNRSIPTIQ